MPKKDFIDFENKKLLEAKKNDRSGGKTKASDGCSLEGALVLCGNPFPRQDVLSLEGLNLIYLISK